jgi:hypothetical protein
MTAFVTKPYVERADRIPKWKRSWHSRKQRQICALKYETATLKAADFSSWGMLTYFPSESTVKSTALQMLDPSDTMTTTTFEPVLNVPALFVFVLIMGIFVLLQRRVSSIEAAAEDRTLALQQLRTLKAKELSDPSPTTTERVQAALRQYEMAYNRVEELRTILPGVRVIPPPSQSLTQERQRENEAAAKQFLGIEQPQPLEPLAKSTEKGMSPFLTAVLVLVASAQIALLVLLITSDPMVSSTQWSSF